MAKSLRRDSRLHDNGKPVARRGRKATDLTEAAGLPKGERRCVERKQYWYFFG